VRQQYDLLDSYPFWIGLSYCTFPLNILCYVMNDYMDVATDQINPRKGNLLFGAKADISTLRKVYVIAIVVQIPFFVYFLSFPFGYKFVLWFFAFLAVNSAYNIWPKFSDKAPFDLILPLGYMLCIPLAQIINNSPSLPWLSWLHGALLVVRVQVWTEMLDVRVDLKVKRKTSMATIGILNATIVMWSLTFAELHLTYNFFRSYPLLFFECLSLCSVLDDSLPHILTIIVTIVEFFTWFSLYYFTWTDGCFLMGKQRSFLDFLSGVW